MTFADSTCLPADYCPPNNVAVLGRGKRYINHPGNRRLRELVLAELPAYNASTTTRKTKSATILRVIEMMRTGTEGKIGFVRYDTLTGNLYLVDDGTARVCVAQTFRDCLSKNYRSSKQFKRKKRQEIRENSPDMMGSSPQVVSPPPCEDVSEDEDRIVPEGTKKFHPFFPPSHGADSQVFLSSLLDQTGAGQPRSVPVSENKNSAGRYGEMYLDSVSSNSAVPLATFLSQGPASQMPQGAANAQQGTMGLFDSLFDIFGSQDVPVEDNPFEPRPLLA